MQATVNRSRTLLGYVDKRKIDAALEESDEHSHSTNNSVETDSKAPAVVNGLDGAATCAVEAMQEVSHEHSNSTENGEGRTADTSPVVTRGEVYSTCVVEVKSGERTVHNLNTERSKQIRIQFLYNQKEQKGSDRFLVLIHQECKHVHWVDKNRCTL